jgi:ribosomal protein S18 acetylase RimI-like enzyme
MVNQPIVEEALFSDLEEILILQKSAFQNEAELFNDYSITPLVQTLDSIENDFKINVYLKAVSDGIIIGSVRAYLDDNICNIGRLIVHPDYQNKGIGRLLMNSIESYFKNCTDYSLFTAKRIEKNLRFYEKLGYKTVREEKINDNLIFVYYNKECL